ncbi:hypothetical protein [Paenibacillus sp. NFR01]|uniref:hypothetical protein n=1 Tax=Paenibacillus sp. NFR01 TaxID=1566279 RepID=UPI0020C90E67|nr:hypothetical protein [Paenibacillus sp. NFR01]
MSEAESTAKAGESFYWNSFFEDPAKPLSGMEASWINIIRDQDGYLTGWVLVKILPMSEKAGNGDVTPRFKDRYCRKRGFSSARRGFPACF